MAEWAKITISYFKLTIFLSHIYKILFSFYVYQNKCILKLKVHIFECMHCLNFIGIIFKNMVCTPFFSILSIPSYNIYNTLNTKIAVFQSFQCFSFFLAKLIQGGKYVFRVIAHSTANVASSPSPEMKLEIQGRRNSSFLR